MTLGRIKFKCRQKIYREKVGQMFHSLKTKPVCSKWCNSNKRMWMRVKFLKVKSGFSADIRDTSRCKCNLDKDHLLKETSVLCFVSCS